MKNPKSRLISAILLGLATLAATLFLPFSTAAAQTLNKRLILKDGSYQIVTQWEVKGDRVRFYSSERSQWEEMPNALIDWDATNKYNTALASRATQRAEELKEIDAEEKADKAKEEAASPEIAPGVRLPSGAGVYMLDTFRGVPQLIEMGQSGGEVNAQRAKNILRAAINPLALSSKQSIELPGPHASVQAHEVDPEFYVNAEDQAGAAQKSAGYRIVRVGSKQKSRVVGSLSVGLTGKVKEDTTLLLTTSKPVAGGSWLKITPSSPLPIGEYALVEMLNDKEMNLYVWDFGVNPSAPQNSAAWKPYVDPKVLEQQEKEKEKAEKQKAKDAKKQQPKP